MKVLKKIITTLTSIFTSKEPEKTEIIESKPYEKVLEFPNTLTNRDRFISKQNNEAKKKAQEYESKLDTECIEFLTKKEKVS